MERHNETTILLVDFFFNKHLMFAYTVWSCSVAILGFFVSQRFTNSSNEWYFRLFEYTQPLLIRNDNKWGGRANYAEYILRKWKSLLCVMKWTNEARMNNVRERDQRKYADAHTHTHARGMKRKTNSKCNQVTSYCRKPNVSSLYYTNVGYFCPPGRVRVYWCVSSEYTQQKRVLYDAILSFIVLWSTVCAKPYQITVRYIEVREKKWEDRKKREERSILMFN